MSPYSPQHPVLKCPQSMFFSLYKRQASHPYTTGKITDLYILIFMFLERRREDENEKRMAARIPQI